MWPWGHAAVGYLLVSGDAHLRRGTQPTGGQVSALLVGTQLPDLIDKPLAWTVGLLPTGRSLAHSLLVVVPIIFVAVLITTPHRRRQSVIPLAVGWVSHSGADAATIIVGDSLAYANFLMWPLLTTPPYETAPSFAAHLATFALTPYFLLQFALAGIAAGLWLLDGVPGMALLRRLIRTHSDRTD